jgi:hypothetical protein
MKMISVKHSSGSTLVTVTDGATKPYAVCLQPRLKDDCSNINAPSRIIKFKTLDAVVARLEQSDLDLERRQAYFAE